MKDQELHKAAEKATDIDGLDWENVYAREKFIEGAQWQQEQFKKESTAHYIDRHIVEAMVEVAKQKMYSEEEVINIIYKIYDEMGISISLEDVLKQFKK